MFWVWCRFFRLELSDLLCSHPFENAEWRRRSHGLSIRTKAFCHALARCNWALDSRWDDPFFFPDGHRLTETALQFLLVSEAMTCRT